MSQLTNALLSDVAVDYVLLEFELKYLPRRLAELGRRLLLHLKTISCPVYASLHRVLMCIYNVLMPCL